jgi:hypothetical protein
MSPVTPSDQGAGACSSRRAGGTLEPYRRHAGYYREQALVVTAVPAVVRTGEAKRKKMPPARRLLQR